MRVLYSGLGFTEGPCQTPDGLAFVSVSKGNLYVEGEVLAHLGGGPNGVALGPDGRLFVTQNGGVDYRAFNLPVDDPYDPVPPGVLAVGLDGQVETVVGPQGVSAPNDLVFDGHRLVFTDSGAAKVLDGELRLVSDRFEYPNGIALGPGGLWVADTHRRQVIRLADGHAVQMPGAGPDGICFDDEGRLYAACTVDGAVHVFEPDGRRLGSYVGRRGDLFTNCCLRGPDLVVTAALPGEVVAFDRSEMGG